MKTTKSLAILIFFAGLSPILLADTATDRRIEETARSSYNLHVVLHDQVTATANAGIVTLTGTVEDDDSKLLAENTIKQIPDVTGLDDEITVKPASVARRDALIAFKIHCALLFRANVSDADTQVAVNDGVVTVTGMADSEAQEELTIEIVKEIAGVKSVTDSMTVRAPASPNPEQTIGAKIDDASITAQVKYELLTHRSTSAVNTKVETRDGVVTVSGEADSDAERDLVTLLAKNVRGVQSVTNHMTVKLGT